MPFYEVIYETGADSIAFYESDAEALEAVQLHHERAVNGQPGGPAGFPAERVVKLLRYDAHPADLPLEVSDDVAKKVVADAIKEQGGTVNLNELSSAVLPRARKTSPEPHESKYVMAEAEEVSLPWQ